MGLHRMRRHRRAVGLAGALLALLLLGSAYAQSGSDIYRLPAGEVLEDDLYIGAQEIYIDGTIKGDLNAAAAYIEVSGVIEGDANVAGGSILVSGRVADDVRAAAAGFELSGLVGDDLYAAAGGGPSAAFVPDTAAPSLPAGLRVGPEAQIGGNAGLFGGDTRMAGAVSGDLLMGSAIGDLSGSVGGNARLESDQLSISPGARVAGELRYSDEAPLSIPSGVSDAVVFDQQTVEPETTPAGVEFGWRLYRIVMTVLGIVLLGLLLIRARPQALRRPAAAIAARPGQATLFGFATAAGLIFVPLVSALLVFAMVLFWGWFPGIVLLLLLFAALSMIWFLSPLVTGLWLGQLIMGWFGREVAPLAALALGAALILLLGLVPVLGWLVGLASFVLALGGIIVAARGGYDAQPASLGQAAPTPA